jgi:hypothetical protein
MLTLFGYLNEANNIGFSFLSAGATQYLLIVAALYGIGACLYAGKYLKKI